ncbi:MAG: [FeFe] hydrogenase, group A, partial [Treponema sp.]|nr:[FeFe] hydrogenase, group A [Treponema sp.]
TTILAAARIAGADIPTLCYQRGLNDIGACRVCSVEVQGLERLVSACNTPAEEGIAVLTNSPRVRQNRRVNVGLLLSRHDCRCPVCVRSGNCRLQTLANDLGLPGCPYKSEVSPARWDKTFPLQRDAGKCVQCLRCVQVCDKIQSLGVWSLANYGSRQDIAVSGNREIAQASCSLCGQCITHCPTGALSARDDTEPVLAALANPEITTIVQAAPAVRSAWAETLGLSRQEATPGKMAAALRRLGFDYVFDTDFAADLTIMEEGAEFLERVVQAAEKPKYPLFTSCCPGWVRFVKDTYPGLVPYLSTAKSPQQMFGATAKTYFAELKSIDPKKLFVASIMPCVAKKSEITLPDMDASGAGQDVDAALTTRELARMLRADSIVPANLGDEAFDSPLGEATGAGVIFGMSGGVMDAALRTVYYTVMGKNPPADAFQNVRQGMKGITEAEFALGDVTVKVAVASGLGNAARLLDAVVRGEARYDFVEVMACPGGCAGGGGQPIALDTELAEERSGILAALDKGAALRYSHENPEVARLYAEYLGKPLSPKAHHLLHTGHGIVSTVKSQI